MAGCKDMPGATLCGLGNDLRPWRPCNGCLSDAAACQYAHANTDAAATADHGALCGTGGPGLAPIAAHRGQDLTNSLGPSLCARSGAFTAPHESRLNSRWDLLRFPNADLARLRHQEETEDEADRWDENWIEQRIPQAAGCRERGGRDERHQPAAPAVPDVIG